MIDLMKLCAARFRRGEDAYAASSMLAFVPWLEEQGGFEKAIEKLNYAMLQGDYLYCGDIIDLHMLEPIESGSHCGSQTEKA